MTADEKRKQRVELELELEEAQSDLAHVREKATRQADNLEKIAAKIRYNAGIEPSSHDFTIEAQMTNKLGPECPAMLDYSELLRTVEELTAARQKLHNFYTRKRQLTQPNVFIVA